MKKLFYFSEKSLKFVEIKHFKTKAISVFIISVLLFSSIAFGVFYAFSNIINSSKSVSSLESENLKLREKIKTLSDKYLTLEDELNNISKVSNDIRLAVDLEPITEDERLLGTGGTSTFGDLLVKGDADLSNSLKAIDKVATRFEFEKQQYDEILSKLKENEDLYASIPAIIPTEGSYSVNGYGMRMHPILKRVKMHRGIDIICDVGTDVKASGKGKIEFVGRRGGYGLAVEIDHGYGYKTVYGHLSKVLVKEGQKVSRGDLIGKSGNSGLSTGPHLHYEVIHKGTNVDPITFFFDEYAYFESYSAN